MVVMTFVNEMQSDRHCPRIDTVAIKFQIERALGLKKSEQYFDILNRYFSLKLSKGEFDKLCVALVGRGNICLHNNLIRAIVNNAAVAKTPPRRHSKDKALQNEKVSNVHQERNPQSLCRDGVALSQRKGRTPIQRDRKFRDQPSPLGPLGKTQINSSASELQSLGSRPPVEVNSVEEGEEVEQADASPSIYSRSPVRAPLGIPLNAKGTKKLLFHAESPFSYTGTCQKTSMLPDTDSLKKRLERKLGMEGLNASTDCINLLNNGLNVYMKKLVNPCVHISSSKSGQRHNYPTHPRIPVLKPNKSFSVSILDFGVATELNPRILGEDWPLKLEKISLRASE